VSSDAHDLYLQGLKQHRARDYEQAVRLLEEAVRVDPQHADSWEALGVLYDKVDRLDDAITAMERLRELDPTEIMAHTNLSRFYQKKGWTEKAEDAQAQARILGWKQDMASGGGGDFAQAGAAPPPGAAPVDIAGLASAPPVTPATPAAPDPAVLARKIEQFEAIVGANDQDVLGRLSLGKFYLQADRPADSIKVLEELLVLQPDSSAAFVILGEAYEKVGKRARAMSTYSKGIELAESKGDLDPRNKMKDALARLKG